MFERLLSFLKELPGRTSDGRGLTVDDPRVAAAALLFHVMDADGDRAADEHARLEEALKSDHGVGQEDLEAVMAAGEEAERSAIDLYAFTSVLNRHLEKAARLELVQRMWEVVYADGEVHEIEDNVMWRVAELLGIDSQERIALRMQARNLSDEI